MVYCSAASFQVIFTNAKLIIDINIELQVWELISDVNEACIEIYLI